MTTAYEKIDERLRRLPDWAVFAFGMLQALAIVAVKTIALPGVPLTDFLLIPVAWTGWLSRSRTYAYAAAVCIAGVTVFIAEVGPTRAPLAATLVSAGARLLLYLIALAVLRAIRRVQVAREEEARTDHLTGVANGRAFEAIAAREIAHSRRRGGELSLLYLDVDEFKDVNDRFGHGAGDEVLTAIGEAMVTSVRASDVVARLGGDEFAVLMPGTGRFAAVTVARRMRERLGGVVTADGGRVRFSIGVVSYAVPPTCADAMIRDADAVMYRAKGLGKDRIESVMIGAQASASTGA